MFTKKAHQDVKKSIVKIQDAKKDSATRFKHLKIILDHFDAEDAKNCFEENFSHVYFILYDNFIQAENNLRQKVHKAGKEELEASLALLDKVLCLLPELLGKRWQLHSLTRIFSKLLHPGNTQKLRTDAIRFFLLWYQALGDNAPQNVHKMFATLVPGFPEPHLKQNLSPIGKIDIVTNALNERDFNIENIMQHPNFSSPEAKNVIVEQTPTGIIGKIANVSASIFHDTNVLNPVQGVEIQALLPASSSEKSLENETKFYFEILLEAMASSVTKIQWRDRSHNKSMKSFAFLLEKFKLYYLPVVCPQFDHKNSLYKPNLELPVHHNILEDNFITCRVTLIKWVANYAHSARKQDNGQPTSMMSVGSQHSATPTPGPYEEETSFTVGHPSDSSRASSHDSANNTPHQSLESGSASLSLEELNPDQVVRDVLCCSSRDQVDFTIEVLRQAFLLPFSQAAAVRRVIALYKDWIQMNMSDVPPFVMNPPNEWVSEPPVPPRRFRNDSYIGAIAKDNVLLRAGLQNVLQIFMSQAANVFVASPSPVAPPGGLNHQHLLEEQTDTCKRVLNIYRYLVMHVNMDDRTWEQLLLVLLQITSLVLTKSPTKRKQDTLGGHLAPALFQTLIVTWIKANLNVAVKPDLWQNFVELLSRLTHWEELINEWAKTMETLTRVLARHVYSLELSESVSVGKNNRNARRPTVPPPGIKPVPTTDHVISSKSSKTSSVEQPDNSSLRKGTPENTRRLHKCKSDLHLAKEPSNDCGTSKSSKDSTLRRWLSFDSLQPKLNRKNIGSLSGSRSSSPAPSSGLESSSIKDSPLQLDLASDGSNVEWWSGDASCVGVALGGRARGWLPGVAGLLWRRMLSSLGDPNLLPTPNLHLRVFKYLLHLNDTLQKISLNQTLTNNTEIHVPFNIFAGWCLEAEALPASHRAGKLLALRLLCESTQAQAASSPTTTNNLNNIAHLHLYQRALHHGLTGEDRSVVDVLVQHSAPRFLSLSLDGSSLLLLDFVHASTVVLNSSDISPSCPRTAAVTFLGSLLALPDAAMAVPMLQPYPHQYNTVSCPDLKEHVLNIVVRVCRREGCAAARAAGGCGLSSYIATALADLSLKEPPTSLPTYVSCLLHMLMMKNKTIAKVISDCIYVLADYTDRIIELYPDLAGTIIRWICACLVQLSSSSSKHSVKPLAGSLLLCLAEYSNRCGPAYLMKQTYGGQSLLLIVFKVLYAVMNGTSSIDIPGLALQLDEDFDPNIQVDNLGTKVDESSTIDVKLWAQTICNQLVMCLGHWPLWGSWQMSSSVCEHHDIQESSALDPALHSTNLLMMTLGSSTIASMLQLPAIDSAATTPGLVMSEQQLRIILRDSAGKYCWDASALQYEPNVGSNEPVDPLPMPEHKDQPKESTLSSLPPPLPPDLLPDWNNSPPDKHQLDHVLAYISHTSPEVLSNRPLHEVATSPLSPGAEDALLAALVNQSNAEKQYLASHHHNRDPEPLPAVSFENESTLWLSRGWVSQWGWLASQRRTHISLLNRSDKLLRELRNLDALRCRETHKIALIYVGKGQETRNEILSNRCGSPAYEAFLAALAWEVELESHVGFSGGLRGGVGLSAPYVASLTLELLFHVATRMPSDTPEDLLNKTRHLGNDEVHVVWSEHWRPYKRDVLPTQFCDVLLCLYPLPGGMVRCTISRKPDVPRFGPVWEESVVPLSVCAALVRGASVCAGRALRTLLPLFRHAYCERHHASTHLATQHSAQLTYEEHLARLTHPHLYKHLATE